MPVLVPPREEQVEIADFLDKKCSAIDSTIKKKEPLIERMIQYKMGQIMICGMI